MIKLAISGAHGRMGTTIANLAAKDNNFEITTLLEHKDHPKANEPLNDIAVSTDNNAIEGSDVLIEFTLPEGTMSNLEACIKHNVKMVIGTTGFSSEQIREIGEASTKIPIVFSGNMSLGVNILFKLTRIVSRTLPQYYDAKIKEAHHIHKKDKPSGTAKILEEIIKMEDLAYSQEGTTEDPRKLHKTESKREGEIIGDHQVVFESLEDEITLIHHAKTRDIFAKGALVAAKFLTNIEMGQYSKDTEYFTMEDVLFGPSNLS